MNGVVTSREQNLVAVENAWWDDHHAEMAEPIASAPVLSGKHMGTERRQSQLVNPDQGIPLSSAFWPTNPDPSREISQPR
jgi:hypothetical protein